MPEDTTPVGNSESAAGDSQSSGGGSQQSVDLSTVLKEFQDLKKMVTGLQKGTDKVNARVEERVNQVLGNPDLARILELSKAGLSSEEIEDRLLLDAMLAERKEKARSGSGGAGSPSGAVDAGLSPLVQEFGLDANDSAVAEALSKNDYAALTRLAVAKAKAPAPDSSSQPPLDAKQKADPKADTTALQAAYQKRIQDMKANRTFNAGSFARLKAEFKQKGLDLH